MNLFQLGLVIGVVIYFLWNVPVIGMLVVALFGLCWLMARYRLVTAFVIGFILGLS
jgi:uncharacterized membrane protein YraQ (UPF0718 family)